MFLSFITSFSGSKGTNEARNYRNGSHNSLTPPKDASKRLPLVMSYKIKGMTNEFEELGSPQRER